MSKDVDPGQDLYFDRWHPLFSFERAELFFEFKLEGALVFYLSKIFGLAPNIKACNEARPVTNFIELLNSSRSSIGEKI